MLKIIDNKRGGQVHTFIAPSMDKFEDIPSEILLKIKADPPFKPEKVPEEVGRPWDVQPQKPNPPA